MNSSAPHRTRRLRTAVLIVALMIKLNSPGPAIFAQTRLGENGKQFTCYKFRTMCQDAETQQEKLIEESQGDKRLFKLKDDPRVTPVGRWLRTFSIDELPQLWNVLVGDMSLVGPRPPIPSEVAQYETSERRRLSMRPGLTWKGTNSDAPGQAPLTGGLSSSRPFCMFSQVMVRESHQPPLNQQ